MRVPRALILALAAGLSGGCSKAGGEPPSPPPERSAPDVAARFRTTDVTAQSGIRLENVSGDPKDKFAIPENLGQGAAALDYDGDGDLDLFIANGDVFPGQTPRAEPRSALYRNDGGLRFVDVTKEAGLLFRAWCHGATAVDFDADGRPDLYVTVFRGPNRFFRNLGNGTFMDATELFGGGDPGPSTSAAFLDADQDGDLDLYVGNYVDYDPQNPPNDGKPCLWKELEVSCGPLGTTPGPDTYYENVDGRLVVATKKAGLDAVEPSYALSVVAADIDTDGDVDLYVANDSRPNWLWLNDGKGGFTEAGFAAGCSMNEAGRAQAGMGTDIADVDRDGRFDIFVTHFSHDHNTLYWNETPEGASRPLFSDASYPMRLGEASFPFLSWGTRIIDIDRDGWNDIVVVSGHVYPQVDGANLGTSYAQPNQVFRNLGRSGSQGPVFELLGFPREDGWSKVSVSRGLVVADLDDDGDQDFLIVEMDAPPTLLRGDGEGLGAFVGVRLVGGGKNTDAIGAIVSVVDHLGIRHVAQRTSGASYLSSHDPRIFFGLGEAKGPLRSLEVRWPDGHTSRFEDVPTGRYVTVDRKETAWR